MTFQFNSMSEFFAMGGYGFYVWLSYGITFLAVGLLICQSKNEIKRTLKQAKQAEIREERLKTQKN